MASDDWKRRIADWMRGRYGSDELGTFASTFALVLVLLNVFLRVFGLSIAALLLMGYAWWRMTSRNIEARANENRRFVELTGPLLAWLRHPIARTRDRRTNCYLSCPSCRQRVRVPKGKGTIMVTCPTCGEKFKAKS